MSAATLKLALAGVLALLLLTAGATWKVQDWRYGKQLAEQSAAYQADLTTISNAAAAQQRTEQDKRLALEQRRATSDQTHHEALTNAQKDQARLRDRLTTSDLQLSVLIAEDSTGTVQCQPVPAPAAWFMEERAPDLTQRMLNELSKSPMPATRD